MAENDFSNIIKGFMIITLFIFLLLSAVIGFSSNYDIDTVDINERIGLDRVTETLELTADNSSFWQSKFEKLETDTTALGKLFDIVGFIAVGFFSLLINMFSYVTIPFSIIQNIAVNVLNIPAIVMNIIQALLIVSLMLGIWRLIKQGR